LAQRGGNPGFQVLHASQVIEMDDAPATALRSKPDNSISKGVGAVANGAAAGFVSMGNTGAVIGAATLGLKTLKGVRRPGIAVTLALTGQPLTFIDMGASIAPRPEDLLQYAAMGMIYMRDCLGVREPRVGLLNIGSEKGKGTDLLKEAYDLLEGSGLKFVGNVEGSELFHEPCDVIVTDGFTGNVVLKLLEHFSGFMLGMVLKELREHQVEWAEQALGKVKRAIDYSTYGGALVLGVNGVVIKGHGRSDAKAVANALAVALRAVDAEVNRHIELGLGKLPPPQAG
jgi:glycerol-3-phosphate acyltransferase PlsX